MLYRGRRIGLDHQSIFYDPNLDPRLQPELSVEEQLEWEKIVAYLVARNTEKLPSQVLLKIPQHIPEIFKTRSFFSEISGNSIVILLKIDQDHGQVIIGDGSSFFYWRWIGRHHYALFPGDEIIVIYYNQGDGNFISILRIIRRFPSAYRSMYMKIHDFKRKGYMYILYVNGDNFKHSQISKPCHGIRIFKNDGKTHFERKCFYPVYRAAKAQAHHFDLYGDLDLIVVANFADLKNNPERGIMYLEFTGLYEYESYAIEASRENQWNTRDIGDIDQDGDDGIVGTICLQNVLKI